MKCIFFLSAIMLAILTNAQDSYKSIHYNKLVEVVGTSYVMAKMEGWSKKEVHNNYLQFINTANGETRQIDFPSNVYFQHSEQIRMDSLGINQILIIVRNEYTENRKLIDMRERPAKVILLSTDGKKRTELTENNFLLRAWTINKQTGAIVITGSYDNNENGKSDAEETNRILVFDLKTLKPVSEN